MQTSPLFEIKLDAFEGPLDLLLHLIKKHELSIFDIPIAFITERFLEVLADMESTDLKVGGEFLVMAATLAHIKSRTLLPRIQIEDLDDDAEPPDPREELVRQLVEYQRYRDLAAELGARDLLGQRVFVRPGAQHPIAVGTRPQTGPLDLFHLLEAFETVRRRVGVRERYEVRVERRTVREEMVRIARQLARAERQSIWALVEEDDAGRPRIESVVGVFLALLEMVKLRLVAVFQRRPDEGDLAVAASVDDLMGVLRERWQDPNEPESGSG